MRTTLNIKDEFIEEVIRITGAKNKSKAINKALEQFVRERRCRKLISLKGKLHLEENWQKLRDMELHER
jgi:Arc/MetJ family transcription regulator